MAYIRARLAPTEGCTVMTCQHCGRAFTQITKGRRRKYCTPTCRRAADRERQEGRGRVQKAKTCARCGKKIEQGTTGRPRRFCSTFCRLSKPAQIDLAAS